MGDNTIPAAVDGTPIPAAHHNSHRTSQIGDLIPRNASAAAADAAGSLGRSAYRWLFGYIKTLILGETADNISIETSPGISGNDVIIKVAGTERARIPQTVGLLPAGMIVMYSGTSDPDQWLICDGREVSRTTYARLYAAVGDTYGQGNGSSTFNLPDFRGRFPRGADDAGTAQGDAGLDPDSASRTAMAAGGNSANNVGSIQDDAFESHTHDKQHGDVNNSIGTVGAKGQQSNEVTLQTAAAGGSTETRPKNFYTNFIIKT